MESIPDIPVPDIPDIPVPIPKRGRGRPRKVVVPETPEAPEAPTVPEPSLRCVMERLDGMEKRLTPPPVPVPVAENKNNDALGLGYLNARRSQNRAQYHSFMPQ
jgi:hypothetical protein